MKLQFARLFFLLLLCTTLLGLFTGCNQIARRYFGPDLCCPNFRRPPVMTGEAECTLDYNEGLIAGEALCCTREEEPNDKVPLKPEDFNPWKPLEMELHLSRGDVLTIGVFGDTDTYYNEVTIAPDGRLYYTFLEGIPAAGRTIDEVSDEMESKLTKYFIHPTVTITPVLAAEQSYKVFGRVAKPGVYTLTGPLHLREAIGEAGGLLLEEFNAQTNTSQQLEEIVDLEKSFIIRDKKKLDVDFTNLMHDPTSKQDIFIKPGDYIYIASFHADQVYVLGNVRQPQRVSYVRGLRLVEAIADATGWVWGDPYGADITKVMLIRGRLECPLVVLINLQEILYGEAQDVILEPGDIIYVMDKTMRFGRVLVRSAINTFIQSFATAAGSYYAQFNWFKIFPDTESSVD